MKRTVIILFMILSSLYCKAQIIMSIEEYEKYKNTTEEGQFPDYVKDINGTFNKYVGTWKGTDDNNTYEFIVTKVTSSFDMHVRMFKYDALLVRYKITDSNGKVLVTTKTLADNNSYVIKGLGFTEEGSYKLSFRGTDNNLKNDGDILLDIYNGKMRFLFYPEPKVIFGDPPNYFPNKPLTFPREKAIYLTKQ
ncbi:DUF6705 family protein [Flavobacterium piscis]|uniref:DUF6705 domain-containing protein n=1 Tax=Flavobacterium piscis TaxID=1114874 RepID=A0ABU1YBW6_9FLAO|nr:DUF6705 family protein [Flavobacterium piscis]MDR7211648.1 hypothetical protein [Flavobacterium piscis]